MFKLTVRGLRSHLLRLGATALAVVLGVSFMVGTTVLGDTYRANIGGLISGSGTVELLYTASSADETNVFIEMVNSANDDGAALFELYLYSTTKKITFDGVITSAEYSATVGEIEVITCNFVTNGAITLDI